MVIPWRIDRFELLKEDEGLPTGTVPTREEDQYGIPPQPKLISNEGKENGTSVAPRPSGPIVILRASVFVDKSEMATRKSFTLSFCVEFVPVPKMWQE